MVLLLAENYRSKPPGQTWELPALVFSYALDQPLGYVFVLQEQHYLPAIQVRPEMQLRAREPPAQLGLAMLYVDLVRYHG